MWLRLPKRALYEKPGTIIKWLLFINTSDIRRHAPFSYFGIEYNRKREGFHGPAMELR
jgi:hypothetical protein